LVSNEDTFLISQEGAFVDVRIDAIGNDGERGSFFAHSIIMCAASHYFRKILMTQRESVSK